MRHSLLPLLELEHRVPTAAFSWPPAEEEFRFKPSPEQGWLQLVLELRSSGKAVQPSYVKLSVIALGAQFLPVRILQRQH
jgi:hypothetical protein